MARIGNRFWILIGCTLIWASLAVMVGGFVSGFLFWIGLGLLAYEWLVVAASFSGLAVTRELSADRLMAGEHLEVKLHLTRRLALPFYWFVVKDRSDLEEDCSVEQAHFYLSDKADLTVEYKVYQLKRGRYVFRGMECSAGDLFGFITRTRFVAQERTVLVYPRLHPVGDLMAEWTEKGPEHRKNKTWPDPSVVSGIRNYEHGDRLQRIHWKASARGQGLKVKELDREAAEEYLLVLDQREQAYRGRSEEVFERAVSMTASLAREWIRRQIPVSVLLTGKVPLHLMPATTEEHFVRILEYLVDVKPDGKQPLDPQTVLGRRGWGRQARVVLITPEEDVSVRSFAEELKRLNIRLTCVAVNEESAPAGSRAGARI
jgi:uncharacterized protein (DUF58 family)